MNEDSTLKKQIEMHLPLIVAGTISLIALVIWLIAKFGVLFLISLGLVLAFVLAAIGAERGHNLRHQRYLDDRR